MPGRTGDHTVTRLLRFVEPEDFRRDGCWIFRGTIKNSGYGWFNEDGHPEGAHRVAYRLFIGPIPAGFDVCHSCDNRPCIRPDHLFAGTRSDNVQDAIKKGRISRGEKHSAAVLSGVRIPAAKLSPAAVQEIHCRLQAGHKPSAIARDFCVTPGAINAIRRGDTWAHITGRRDVK